MIGISKDVQHLIDIFDPPPIKWVSKEAPDFGQFKHPELEEDKYWDEESRRWVEGHINERGEFINPMQYFYLQNCWLNDNDGNIFRPRFRDTDELMATWSTECIRDEQSLLVYKARDKGATSFFANLPFYFMRNFPGCKIGMTGKDQKNINAMFNDKVMHSYNRFNKKVLNTVPIAMSNSSQKNSLTISLKVFDETLQTTDTRTSILFSTETSEKPDSPTNLSGNRFKYVYVDEAALHKRIEAFLGSIFPALNRGPRRTGLLVMAGTVEPNLTTEEVGEFYKLIERVKNLRVRTEMIPVYMSMFEKNGYSNMEAGLLWYEENRAHFENAGDLKGLRDFRMQYPKDKNDIFDLSQGGLFEQDVADLLSHTYIKRMGEKNEELPYKLIQTSTGVDAIPDTKTRVPEKDGGHWIIEHPKNGIQYYQAIDGIGTGKKEGAEKGSWIGCIIFKGFDPQGGSFSPVAVYYERPNMIEDGYIQMANQWNYFNQHGGGKEINYEVNASTGDHFGLFLQKRNLYKYTHRRWDNSNKGYIDTKKRGTAVNAHTRDWQVRQGNIFLRVHGSSIKSKLLLQSLLKLESDNADLRDAFFIFMLSVPDFDKPVVKKSAPQTKTIIKLIRNAQGQTVYHTEQVAVMSQADELTADMAITKFESYEATLKKKYGEYAYQKATDDEKEKYRMLKNTGQ